MTRLQSIEFQRSRHRRKRHARVERDPLKAGDRVPSLSRVPTQEQLKHGWIQARLLHLANERPTPPLTKKVGYPFAATNSINIK